VEGSRGYFWFHPNFASMLMVFGGLIFRIFLSLHKQSVLEILLRKVSVLPVLLQKEEGSWKII
jgi:hypothetical protein